MVRRRCPVIDLFNWNRVLWIFHTYMYGIQYCYFTEWITSCLFDHFEMLNEINVCLIGYFELSAHFPREGNINAKFVIAYGDLYDNPCCYKPVQFKPSIMNLQYCHYCYTMVTWKVFTQHTTMHGIKNIHMEKIHLARR